MNMPFAIPDWLPWWVPLVLLVPALLYALAFLFMPFSVLGVKTRLEAMEARLDDIQQEIRLLALRLPVGPQVMEFEDVYAPIARSQRRESVVSGRPPIPPVAKDLAAAKDLVSKSRFDEHEPLDRPAPPPHMRPIRKQEPLVVRSERPERSEPRLDSRR